MTNPLTAAWDYLRGAETKTAAPPPTLPPPTVQSLVWSPSSYPDAAGLLVAALQSGARGSPTAERSPAVLHGRAAVCGSGA